MSVEGGSARPIHITTNAPTAGPALPVYLYTQATLGDRKIESGITSVYSVSDSELANGTFKLQGNVSAIPVIDYTSQDTSAPDIHPMPVYILNPSMPTPPVVNWWLAGGVNPANCVAAYQSKGVADYATSKVNLANPGTFDLTAPIYGANMTEPSWTALNGWSFREAPALNNGDALNTGITSTNLDQNNFSAVVKYSGLILPRIGIHIPGYYSGAFYGAQFETDIDSPEFSGYMTYNESTEIYHINAYSHDAYTGAIAMYETVTIPTTGIWIIAGNNMYLDGLSIYTGPYGNAFTGSTPELHIGAIYHHYYSIDYPDDEYYEMYNHFFGNIQAIAFYNSNLTAGQVAAITTAMQAL